MLQPPEAVRELARLAMHAKSETARIAAIRELLDRGFGKPTQFAAADNEPALDDLNLEELRGEILAQVRESSLNIGSCRQKGSRSFLDRTR
jgi:hypothetical protein